MSSSFKTAPNVKNIFSMLRNIVRQSFDPLNPAKSCGQMAGDIYLLLGRVSFSNEGHIPFLRDVMAARMAEAKECFGPLTFFFKEASTHVYLLENEKNRNVNPMLTQANVLSSLFHFLIEAFHMFTKEEQEEFHEDGCLRLFEKKDDFYKFISFLNSTEFNGFSRNEFRLCNFDLSGANLGNADLGGADLKSADLSGANLSGANLSNADLSGANLAGADLREANLKHACPRGANLSRANLGEAKLSDTVLKYAHMEEAILSSANLAGADLSHTDLRAADLRGSDLTGANLTSAHLREADLSLANLIGAYLIEANLIGADLSGANLIDADMSRASLVGANLSDTNLDGANLDGANFMDGADMSKAREVSREQIGKAIVDISTKLPVFLKRRSKIVYCD